MSTKENWVERKIWGRRKKEGRRKGRGKVWLSDSY